MPQILSATVASYQSESKLAQRAGYGGLQGMCVVGFQRRRKGCIAGCDQASKARSPTPRRWSPLVHASRRAQRVRAQLVPVHTNATGRRNSVGKGQRDKISAEKDTITLIWLGQSKLIWRPCRVKHQGTQSYSRDAHGAGWNRRTRCPSFGDRAPVAGPCAPLTQALQA